MCLNWGQIIVTLWEFFFSVIQKFSVWRIPESESMSQNILQEIKFVHTVEGSIYHVSPYNLFKFFQRLYLNSTPKYLYKVIKVKNITWDINLTSLNILVLIFFPFCMKLTFYSKFNLTLKLGNISCCNCCIFILCNTF